MRDERGRWIPGSSGNRTGRSPGFKGVSRMILQETGSGAELVKWALDVWRDPTREFHERAQAHQWLADRALGRAVNVSEMNLQIDAGAIALPSGFEALPLAERRRVIDMIEAGSVAALPEPEDEQP